MAFVILLLRALFGLIDGLVFWAGAELYDLMIQIASAKVFQQETILTVSGRVYQLLGLIMLFKLIFSFVTYIINPDDMTDKNKGYANLIKKIIISLCLIVITPWAFTQSRNLQIYIIEDKVIEYFVFGQTRPSNASAGYNLMYTVGKQFVKPYACKTPDCKKSNSETKTLCGSDWDEKLPNISSTGKITSASVGDCAYGVGDSENLGKALLKATKLGTDGKYDLWTLMKLGTAEVEGFLDWFTTGDDFAVDYQFLFSTLVGIAIDYMLIIMCIDMAVRAVKLAFYEIIAPIPIISYVGFKDGKDSMLNKWFGQVVKTYADLFTRVAGLQIAVFFIDQLKNDGFEDNGNFLVTIFLILGALTFAKELPKILEGMGIKFSGGGFNLKKKLTDDMAGSKLLRRAGAAGLGLAGGMAANAYKGVSNTWKNHKANNALKDQMRREGFTSFGKKDRRNFYDSHYGDEKFMKLGSARNRRQYARHDASYAYSSAHAGDTGIKKLWSSTAGKAAAFVGGGQKFTRDNASDFSPGIGSVIAGGVSAAARAATSKDGKMFAGAATGIKGSVDARDLRDKRQEADYGFGTRTMDAVRTFAGVDTAAKERANQMHNQINQMNAVLGTYQNQLNGYASSLNATQINDIMNDPDRYLSDPDANVQGYATTLKAYSKQQTDITKAQKKLEKLYESSGKK